MYGTVSEWATVKEMSNKIEGQIKSINHAINNSDDEIPL